MTRMLLICIAVTGISAAALAQVTENPFPSVRDWPVECVSHDIPSFDALDADRDGGVSFGEFRVKDDQAENIRLFNSIDTDHDDALTGTELGQYKKDKDCP